MAGRDPVRIVKRYGGANGARFAAVTVASSRVDVRVRGSKDGRLLNAWGDPHPFEETRARQIKEKALQLLGMAGNA